MHRASGTRYRPLTALYRSSIRYIGRRQHYIGHQFHLSVVTIKISVVNPIYRSSPSKYRSSIRYIGRRQHYIGRQFHLSVHHQNIGHQSHLSVVTIKISVVNPIYRSSTTLYRSSIPFIGRHQ
ncbi:hypothetical protein [Peribacillus tepidiphilus]|uniref:hypothetical protein n=1 Tax=Peribacillus tepidiphilus TaxID=2652445 RepID=UPI0012912245|nr:hypothetical protein [Peribacillus tepidiphilus]